MDQHLTGRYSLKNLISGDTDTRRIALLLLNMGGPGGIDEVEAYIRRLLSDPLMVQLPVPGRWQARLAAWVAGKRARRVIPRYQAIGGASPVVRETRSIAVTLEKLLEIPVRIAMRYSAPFAPDTISELMSMGIRHIVLLPLYPQFSFTTTDSAIQDIRSHMPADVHLEVIDSHYRLPGLIRAVGDGIRNALSKVPPENHVHLLFTAHSIPLKYVRRGDPYVHQVRETVSAVVRALALDIPWTLAFQSRMGPVKWQGPSLEKALKTIGSVQTLLVQPLSFVTENLETLYDLDIILKNAARSRGIGTFIRLPAPGAHPLYLDGLAELTFQTIQERYQ